MLDKTLILNRIKEHYNFTTDTELADFLGINKSTLSNWYKRNSLDYDLVFTKCEQIDKNWLLSDENTVQTEDNYVVCDTTPLKYDLVISDQDIPIYEISAAAGLSTIFNSGHENIIDTLRLPKLGKCDGAVFLQGDSMYPLMKSGDVVVFKMINNIDYLLFGNIYLVEYEIDGDEYLVCKYVQKGDKSDCVKLVSYNHHHQERDIPMSSIRHLALVKAYVTYNNMH